MTIRKKQSGTLDKTSNTIDAQSDKILAEIKSKVIATAAQKALNKLQKKALITKFGSLPKKRIEETKKSYKDKIETAIGNFMRKFTVTPEAASNETVTGLKKGGLVKKKMNKGGMPKKSHAKPGPYGKAYMKGGMAKKKK